MKLEVTFSDEQWKIVNEALTKVKYKLDISERTVFNNEDRAYVIVRLCEDFLKNCKRIGIWEEFFIKMSKGG